MEYTTTAKTLLFDQRRFFTEKQMTSAGLGLSAGFTLLYACVAAVFGSQGNPISALTVLATVLVGWIIVTGIFFVCISTIGHASCSLRSVAEVTGYGSIPLLIGTILTGGITATIGGFSSGLTTLMNFAVLFWCIPIWVYGLSTVSGLPAGNVLTLIAVPVLAMAALELWSLFAGTGTAASGPASGGTMNRGGTMQQVSVSTGGGGPSGGGMGGGGGPR